MSILATDYVTLSYKGKIIEINTGKMFKIPRDRADTIAQQDIPLSQIRYMFGQSTANWNDYVFNDHSDITQDDVVRHEVCPGDLTFSFVQEPAIYPKS